jgi:hypothetical protein
MQSKDPLRIFSLSGLIQSIRVQLESLRALPVEFGLGYVLDNTRLAARYDLFLAPRRREPASRSPPIPDTPGSRAVCSFETSQPRSECAPWGQRGIGLRTRKVSGSTPMPASAARISAFEFAMASAARLRSSFFLHNSASRSSGFDPLFMRVMVFEANQSGRVRLHGECLGRETRPIG